MRRACIVVLSLIGFGLLLSFMSIDAAAQPARKKSGIDKRIPWTTSKVIGSPEPPPPYKTERVFAKLKFEEPLDMTYAPDTNRLFIAERWGKIYSFENKADVARADLALEIKPGTNSKGMPMKRPIYGFAFHPKFKENGYIYVTWIPNPETEGQPKGSRVSRFTVKGEPPVADFASEKVIFEWPNGGHNGGCLKFGPDGMLYIVTGDGSGIADELVIGQDLGSIFSKMLRLDVDRPQEGKAYSVPKDNPFVNMKGAHPEVYAYGLRQLWRFSFDRKTGDCWGGEVGQDLWEMVYKIEKGGNYGWSVKEGTHDFRPERKRGPTPILKPVVEHPHSDFRSITGGFIYRGARLPELKGWYIYGDFDTGRIWNLAPYYSVPIKENATPQYSAMELARTTHRIITWAEDADGELYYVDFTGGGIYQLAKDTKKDESARFPRKLSETGIFDSTKDHIVAPGVIPYSVNAQLWGDHAVKERFLAIPGNGQIGFDEITYPQPSPGSTPGWRFPDGTVLVKTFAMDMERGNPKSRKRLETRLLHFQQFPGTQEYGDQYWRGYTYKWNDEQTDAVLVDEKGLDVPLKIKTSDGVVEQNYRIPSRAECTLCHTNAHKFALGVATMQMNRDHIYVKPGEDPIRDGSVVANQIDTLNHIGIFSNKVPAAATLPKLADYDDAAHSVETRARSYLHSNCAHCHIKWGGGNAEFKLLATLPLADMGIVNVPPAHGSFNLKDAKILVPGHPEKSILLHRMNMTGLGRMPHIGSRVVHESAVKVVSEWIKGMKE